MFQQQRAFLQWELMTDPGGIAEREREWFAQDGEHFDDRQRRRQRDGTRLGNVRGVAAEARVGGQVGEDADKRRVQCFVDLLHDRRGNDIEARSALHLLRDARQQPMCVVAFPEEPAVHAREPLLTARSHEEQRSTNQQVPPTACRDQRHDRLITVNDDIGEQQPAKHRDEGIDRPARKRVAQPLADDEAEVEEPVTQDGVGERGRHRQEHQRKQRHRRRRENPRARVVPVAGHDPDRRGAANGGAESEHADAASIGHRARSAPVEHQQSECDSHVGDVHQENATCHVGESGRRPEVPHQLHTPVQAPPHHDRAGDECESNPPCRPDPARKDRREREE